MSERINSRIYEGWIGHARRTPRTHAFRYRVFLMYLDLAELPALFDPYWLWSARRPALAWFRRTDHLGAPDTPLDRAVRDLVGAETGRRPRGPIRLLTHLRYFGYCMNPVSFYFCFDEGGARVENVVAEINNTPWGERHCYVLSASGALDDQRFELDKAFHVSPFMGMDQRYAWRFTTPGETLAVRMESYDDDVLAFSATMKLRERALNARSLAAVLARHPCMTLEVINAGGGRAQRRPGGSRGHHQRKARMAREPRGAGARGERARPQRTG
ncbi:MAG: DUF1365 domain-containing protein, partial [Gammaproteobacteria bacterium]|nr:DUF1365 domain-containing protein [Gammaproteobacteria bacterium]